MLFFFVALGCGMIGALPIYFVRDLDKGSKSLTVLISGTVYTLIAWLVFYAGLPSYAYPVFGGFGIMLVIFWIITAIIAGVGSGAAKNPTTYIATIGLIILLITLMTGCEACNSAKYSALIGPMQDKNQHHWSQEIQPLDPTHIRLVPDSVAIALGRTTLAKDGATLGSQYPMDAKHTTLQKIGNDYFYLMPLDYDGWKVWSNVSYVPAYVKVSATDPYAKPLLISGQKMKYTPGAFFGDNLERKLYPKYINKILTDFSFEENDSGKVFWIITVAEPTIGWGGKVTRGVVIFDPENGEDEYVSIEQLEKNPAYIWIDRIIPQDYVLSYINHWGNLKGGVWNSLVTQANLLKGETPTINYSADGRCVFVTPITSTSEDDHAMTGLMYTDARTGETTYYTSSGGATEGAIIAAVNSVVGYRKWHASTQIVYENVYGKLSALVPLIGENSNYQGLAIVENENKRVAFGETPQEALNNYQQLLMNAGGQITTENIKDTREYIGKISRIGWNVSSISGKQYYIYFNDFKNSFTVSSKLESELALTKEGDLVKISFFISTASTVPATSFSNLTLRLGSSKNEQAIIKQMDEKQIEEAMKNDVKDFKEKVKEMNDEDLKKMMDKNKK